MAIAEQLSTLDTAFLELEQSQPSSHMHIGGAIVFDPLPGGGAPSLTELQDRIRSRIGLLPRFSQRLSATQTSAVRWLTWEPMQNFDPGSHVRQATLTAPGGRDELEEWLGDFWSHRLDRHRPLWEMTLLTGLADDRWAIATKTHHCLVDGVGAIDILFLVLDAFGDVEAPAPEHPPEQNGNGNGGGGGGLHFLNPNLLLRHARSGIEGVARPRESLERARAAIDLLAGDDLTGAPQTSLAGELTATRGYRTVHMPLADIKRVRKQHGGTVNDVVLTVCAGAIRKLLLARDEDPPDGIRAQVPVNVRRDDHEHALGNEVSNMIIELPTGEPDPLQRLADVIEREATTKAGHQQDGSKAWLDLADFGPPAIGGAVARVLFGGSRMFNVTITNVPGPQIELTAFDAPLIDALPFVPLFADHTLGIAIVSYNGTLTVGLCVDRHNLPEVDLLADAIGESFAELLAGSAGS